MCTTCGCGSTEPRIVGEARSPARYRRIAPGHAAHGAGWPAHQVARGPLQDHVPLGAVHGPELGADKIVQVERDLLAANDAIADRNRARFEHDGVFALNLVSSPGSGKTSLLVRTIELLRGTCDIAVIEGDQQTSRDADRIRATGAPAVQVNTGKGCHLDARMIAEALDTLLPRRESLLMIENVGNLVCPAAFDLGEAHKVVILSVTEGDDKPLKYPDMFRAADLLIVSKIDLLPHVDFEIGRAVEHARRVRPGIEVLCLSARTGQGMSAWTAWLVRGVAAAPRGVRGEADLAKASA